MNRQEQSRAYNRATAVFGGRSLYKPEEAFRHARRGDPIVGVCSEDGVVLASVTTGLGPLEEVSDADTTYKVSDHIGAATAGDTVDGREVVEELRQIAHDEESDFGEPVSIQHLVHEVESNIREAISYESKQPHGMVALVGGVHNGETGLYEVHPHGAARPYKAAAVGQHRDSILDVIESGYETDLSINDGVALTLSAIHPHYDFHDDNCLISVATVSEDGLYQEHTQTEVENALNTLD